MNKTLMIALVFAFCGGILLVANENVPSASAQVSGPVEIPTPGFYQTGYCTKFCVNGSVRTYRCNQAVPSC